MSHPKNDLSILMQFRRRRDECFRWAAERRLQDRQEGWQQAQSVNTHNKIYDEKAVANLSDTLFDITNISISAENYPDNFISENISHDVGSLLIQVDPISQMVSVVDCRIHVDHGDLVAVTLQKGITNSKGAG